MLNDPERMPDSALPDIYRVKAQYLDSYYNYIDNATSYYLQKNPNMLRRCKGAIISLYKKLYWELNKTQRDSMDKLNLDKFYDLEKAYLILSKKLKDLKIIDIKITPEMSMSFR